MRNKFFIVPFAVSFLLLSWSPGWALCAKREALFKIERSKNSNVVQYNACLLRNNQISEENPVETYWVLGNGKKEELSVLENKQAYGIEHKEKLGEGKFRIVVAALKDREIVVQKVGGNYKAVVRINNEPSILERVYVSSEEKTAGLPSVHYIDLFGRALRTKGQTKERITPK
jgi:hypothetical protein